MTFQLFHSPASPYVRKALVCAHEKGVRDQISLIDPPMVPLQTDPELGRINPMGKIPAALSDAGEPLFDSRVICAYIDTLTAAPKLIPEDSQNRFAAMTLEALADAIMDAALLCRIEDNLRPAPLRWPDWRAAQMAKIDAGLDDLETRWIDQLNGALSVGVIGTGCALGYLDFRFADKDWRRDRPRLSAWAKAFGARASMCATRPPA